MLPVALDEDAEAAFRVNDVAGMADSYIGLIDDVCADDEVEKKRQGDEAKFTGAAEDGVT